ncbi:hypothetical protein EAH81_06025 [Flavobacterium pectinovorum]|uniref:Uncharacterized protein n=1 Tax=Flavobacterium pectinovorum TaxID=29533 RepID=A0A502F3Y1_9FLAO|nr:hypothetical protein EAH81_06025 [Flavobacterium pectinovorum]
MFSGHCKEGLQALPALLMRRSWGNSGQVYLVFYQNKQMIFPRYNSLNNNIVALNKDTKI